MTINSAGLYISLDNTITLHHIKTVKIGFNVPFKCPKISVKWDKTIYTQLHGYTTVTIFYIK